MERSREPDGLALLAGVSALRIDALFRRIDDAEADALVLERAGQEPTGDEAVVRGQIDVDALLFQFGADGVDLIAVTGVLQQALEIFLPGGRAFEFALEPTLELDGHGVAAQLRAGVVEQLGQHAIGSGRIETDQTLVSQAAHLPAWLVSRMNASSLSVGTFWPERWLLSHFRWSLIDPAVP